jgi:hypothetical protein
MFLSAEDPTSHDSSDESALQTDLKKLADRALCLAAWEYEEANRGHQLRQLGPSQLLRLLTHEHLAVTSDGRICSDFLDWCAHAAEKVGPETKKDIMLKLLHHQRWDIFPCLPVVTWGKLNDHSKFNTVHYRNRYGTVPTLHAVSVPIS